MPTISQLDMPTSLLWLSNELYWRQNLAAKEPEPPRETAPRPRRAASPAVSTQR